MQKNGVDGKYLGLTYMDRQNSTYYSLYGGQIEYDKIPVLGKIAVNKIIMFDNLIINAVNGAETTYNGSRNFWEKHNYMINTISNMASGMTGNLEGLSFLKKSLKNPLTNGSKCAIIITELRRGSRRKVGSRKVTK